MDTGNETRPGFQIPHYKLFLIVAAFGLCFAVASRIDVRWQSVGVIAGVIAGSLIAAARKSNLSAILEVGLFMALGGVGGIGLVPNVEYFLAKDGSDVIAITPLIASTSAAIATTIGVAVAGCVAILLQKLRKGLQ